MGRPPLLLAYALILGSVCVFLRSPESITFTVVAGLAFAIGAFGDSLDVTRHLTLFNMLLDLLLLTALYTGLKRSR